MKKSYIYSLSSLLQIDTPYVCHIDLKISSLTAVTYCRLELQPVVTKIPECAYGKSFSPGCHLLCLRWRLFVLSFFPRDVLDEIWDIIESVSGVGGGGFLPTLTEKDQKFDWTTECSEASRS